MKIRIVSIFASSILSLIFAQTATPPALGDGSEGNPYQIATLDNLYWLSQQEGNSDASGLYWSRDYIQTADIDASSTNTWDSGNGFLPIGTIRSPSRIPFKGFYDGQNFSINNLFINRTSSDYIGLFGFISNGAIIKNLELTDVNISGFNSVGSLIGFAESSQTTIQNCNSTGTVSGRFFVGGLLGNTNTYVSIQTSYSSCTVNGTNLACGGLIGLTNDTTIEDCYTIGSVNGVDAVGGLIGYNYDVSIVKNCYSIGEVNGSSRIGGLIGFTENSGTPSSFLNSFWDTETSGLSGIDDGVGNQTRAVSGVYDKTTAEMKDLATFTDISTAGLTTAWDFETNPNDDAANDDFWDKDFCNLINYGYPFLSWENDGTVSLPIPPPGSGTSGDPYQVSILDHLIWISNNSSSWSSYFEQTADIDASAISTCDDGDGGNAEGFSPIGIYPIQFTGSFDGQSHTIDGLFINRPSMSDVGFIGTTDNCHGIQNLRIANANITGYRFVGALIGNSDTDWFIKNCYSSGSVSGDQYLGGSFGTIRYSTISECYSTCSVNGEKVLGGLIGMFVDGELSNCYARGAVTGEQYIGGLIGDNFSNGTFFIKSCYSTGLVIGTSQYGGLIGTENSTEYIENSFWDTETSGQSTSQGGTGKTTAQMKDLATFTDETTDGLTTAWDFEGNPNDDASNDNFWDLCSNLNNGYPILSWQNGIDVCLIPCISGSIIYNTETGKFNFCEDGFWVEK